MKKLILILCVAVGLLQPVPAGVTVSPSGGQTALQVQALIDAAPGVRKSVAATAHGFVVGDVLRMDGTAYVKAQSDSDTNAEAIGMVASVTDANNFILATGGFVSGLSGLTAGATYFLSPTTSGAITATEPSTDGQISKPVFIATTTTAGYFFNMRGAEVGASVSEQFGTASVLVNGGTTVTLSHGFGLLGSGMSSVYGSPGVFVFTKTTPFTPTGDPRDYAVTVTHSAINVVLITSVAKNNDSEFTVYFLDAAGSTIDPFDPFTISIQSIAPPP